MPCYSTLPNLLPNSTLSVLYLIIPNYIIILNSLFATLSYQLSTLITLAYVAHSDFRIVN